MPDYFVTGAKGAGKGVVIVSKMREYILDGCVIATNMDINLAKMFPDKVLDRNFRPIVYRLPDVPTGEDILYLGQVIDRDTERLCGKPEIFIAAEGLNEKYFGRLILDEFVVTMNSMDRTDPNKASFIKAVPLIRKQGWSSYFSAQHIDGVIKQLRDQVENRVTVSRTDRMGLNLPIPILGWLIGWGLKLFFGSMLPRFHVGTVTYKGDFVETWQYRGSEEVLSCYNTRQMFSDKVDMSVDRVGTYQYLPPYSFVDPVKASELSFPLFNSEKYYDHRRGAWQASKVYGWHGRPRGWDLDPPLRLKRDNEDVLDVLVDLFLTFLCKIFFIRLGRQY